MGVCDICATPGEGTHLAAGQVREAVFDHGFDPFALGLFPRVTPPGYYEHWKNTVVANDVGDWNLCPRCFAAIRPHFAGEPAPLGIHEGAVPLFPAPPAPPGEDRGYVPGRDPLVDAMVAPIVRNLEEEKRKKESGGGGCLMLLVAAGAAVGFHLVFKWGFWASAGAGVGVLLLGALVMDLILPKKR